MRERVYASLEEYTRTTHENEMGRFAKLLLRLPGKLHKDRTELLRPKRTSAEHHFYFPALRSIGLRCMEHLFFLRIVGEGNNSAIDTHLFDLLEAGQD